MFLIEQFLGLEDGEILSGDDSAVVPRLVFLEVNLHLTASGHAEDEQGDAAEKKQGAIEVSARTYLVVVVESAHDNL